MTLRHLKIFIAICDNDFNTTKAAASLHMAQPAVSLALSELEKYYGVKLFDRIGRRLSITEAGRKFHEYASRITLLFDDMEKGMRNWDSFGKLRVGASITIGSRFLPEYVSRFYEEHPGTEVQILVAPTDQLEQKLLANELDFALIEGIPHSPALVSESYMDDHLTAICPAKGALAHRNTISLKEFRNQRFLLREKGSGTREVFDRAVENAGFTVEPVWEATSTASLINAAINGLGIAVIPYRLAEEPISKGLVRPIEIESLDFSRKFYIIYHKEKFLTSSARAFMELCRENERVRFAGN